MEARGLLIDTSVIIAYLRKKNKKETFLWYLFDQGYNLHLSVITIFEIFCGAIDERKTNQLNSLTELFTVIPLSKTIGLKSAEIYRILKNNNKMVDVKDIFIAATALQKGLRLSTLNIDHFSRIDNLNIFKKNV